MSSAFTNTYRHKSGQWLRDANVQAIVAKKPQDTLNVRALKRLPLGMSYPQQCQLLAQLLSHPQLARAPIFLDRTGIGRGISDLIRGAGIKHIACTITGGRESHDDGSANITVSKLELVSRLQAALHSGSLRIAKALPESSVFVKELAEFRASWSESGHLSFNARSGCHDDLVLACALACWGTTSRPKLATELRIPFAS